MPTNIYDETIKQAAERNGLDYAKFRKQLVQESSLNPQAKSGADARGIGQIVPKWWTGKHGLNTLEDFHDPVKSINAAAAIMANNVKTYGGWNQALVAYNAGQGKGNRNIKAYNEGRIKDLPKETQNYLAKLGDAGDAALRLESPNVQPSADSGVLLAAGKPVQSGTRNTAAPARGVQDTTGSLYQDDPEREGWGVSFKSGAKSSVIGTAMRMDNPLAVIQGTYGYTFSDDDLAQVRAANIGAAGAKFVLSNSQKAADVPALIKIAQENRDMANKDRSIAGSVFFGAGEMVGDPITYGTMAIPGGLFARAGATLYGAGAAQLAARASIAALEGGATALATESMRESFTGVDANYAAAVANGALFGAGLSMVGTGVSHGMNAVVRGIKRVETSETARVLAEKGTEGVTDPTILGAGQLDRMAPGWRDVKPTGTTEGVLFQAPDGDTIHPASGTQYSDHNPLNPLYTQRLDDENISRSNLGQFSIEVGDVLAGSKIKEHQQMAFKLFRTSRGYEDGSSGRFGVTAQDVDQTIKGDFSSYQRNYDALREEAYGDIAYQSVSGTKTERRRLFDERVIRAAETGDTTGLLKPELDAVALRLEWYKNMSEMQMNPGARWGADAPSLMNKSYTNPENYAAPIVYNELRMADYISKYGEQGLADMIQRSFIKSYIEDAKVAKRVDRFLEENPDVAPNAHEYARSLAAELAGLDAKIVDVGRINQMLDQSSLSLGDVPDFRRMRSPFGYHSKIDLPDGEKFDVSDLRSFDSDTLDAGYVNQVKGDVSVAVATGMTPSQFQGFLDETATRAKADANLKKEHLAFEKIVGGLYGIGIRSGGERASALLGSLQDVAFMKSSAYMAVLNYAEITAGIMKNGLGFTLRAVPKAGKLFAGMAHGKQTAETMRTAQNIIWGSALDRAILPTYKQAIDNNRRKLYADSGVNTVNTVLGTIRGATQAAAGRWWTARALNSSSEAIIEAARGEFFADLAAAAHGTRKTNFTNKARFHEASLNQQQMDDVMALLKSATSIDRNGNLTIKDARALTRGKAAADLRRYGQFWSERVVQQATVGSTFRWSHLPMVGVFTQFMSFVGKSLNSKLIRGVSDIYRNGNLGEAINMLMVAPMVAGSYYAAITYVQSQKYTRERERKKFLRERLGRDGEWGPLIAGAIKRTSAMAAPSYIYDTIGQTPFAQRIAPEVFQFAGFGKTSVEAKLRRDAQSQAGVVGGVFGDAIEQAPAVKVADSLVGLGTGSVNYMLAKGWTEKEKAAKALTRSLGGLIPNDPLTQRAFMEFKREAKLDR